MAVLRELRKRPELDPIERRKLALEAMCDVRTIDRYLDGKRVRLLCEERIRRVFQNRGLNDLLQKRE